MPDNDDVIERDVVLIEPDLSGFRRKLERKIAREMAGAKVDIPVYLKEQQAAENYVAGLRAKYIKDTIARTRNLNEKIQQAERQAYNERFSRVRSFTERVQAAEHAAYAERIRLERATTREVERQASRQAAARKKSLQDWNKYRQGPPIINYGGAGIRPMNLLYGSIAALTPALFAMAANAVQASTSLVALGSAGIGAALGVGALVTAFQGIGDAWKLRKTIQNEGLKADANAARKSVKSAASERAAQDRITDALETQKDARRDELRAYAEIHKARQEAIRDLEDLRQKVVDLNNEYRSNQLSVREAEENERAVNNNFFATATQRLRAHQDTLDARTRMADTRLQRRQARQDLRDSIKKGIEGSDKVVAAKQTAADARRRRLKAARDLARARSGDDVAAINAIDPTSSAAAQLEDKLKRMAPAARDIYFWLDKNEKKLQAIQRQIAQATLPGFYRFLQEINTPVHGKTTIQVFADAMGELGGLSGRFAARIGHFMNTSLFRKGFDKIQRNNAEGFLILGDAAIKFMRPLTRILAAAAPLFPKMARGLSGWVDTFDKFIARSSKDGSLGKWFEDAYESGRKWMGIAGNLLGFLKNLFMLSLPTGGSLVDDFLAFTGSIRDWSQSPTGIRQATRFFEFFRDLPYAQIRDFFLQAAQVFISMRAVKWAFANPFFTAMGLLAASHPQGATDFLTAFTKTASALAGLISANPEITAFVLALWSGNRLRKSLGLTMAIPGLSKIKDLLTSKFKVLDKVFGGGATTGTMTVNAGVVNVYGKAIGAPGAQGNPARPGRLTNPAAVGGGFTIAALLGAQFASQGYGRGKEGKGFFSPFQEFANNPNLETFANTLQMASVVGAAAYAAGLPQVGKFATALNRFSSVVNPFAGAVDRFLNKGKEDFQFGVLKGDVLEYGRQVHADNDTAVDNRAAVRDYIAARKAAVDAAVENARATKDEAAAEQVREYETRRSVDTLRTMLTQYGWNEQKADAYARAIYGLNEINEKQRLSNIAAVQQLEKTRTQLRLAGKDASTAATEAQILASKLDQLDGTRTITVTIDGKAAVFKDLETALIYQRLLETGQPATQGNINKQRAAFRKQEAPAMRDGGRVWGPGTATSDSVRAWLSRGEFVEPAATVNHYGSAFMERLRRREVPREVVHFREGGEVWPFKVGWPKHTATAVTPAITGGNQTYVGKVPRGLGAVGHLTARMMGAVVDAHHKFPWESVTSGYRPGSITVTGNRSYHGYGRATDWLPSMELFNYFVEKYGNVAKEIIFSPAGGRQIWNGKPHMYSGKVRDTHWNHVHLALANGGLVNADTYDTGGNLPPGFTLAYNGTGKTETVRTAEQEKALTGPMRLHPADIRALASALGGQGISMDGRRVAEVTNKYNYVPAGV